jgi:hypothetical protein
MNTPLGLDEIDAVRATLDMAETGNDNPNVHTLKSLRQMSYRTVKCCSGLAKRRDGLKKR